MDWKPIETAPKGEEIIVWYDDGTCHKIEAESNNYDFKPYKKPEQVRGFKIAAPQYWCKVTPPLEATPSPIQERTRNE